MERWIASVGLGIVILCLELGCVWQSGSPDQPAKAADQPVVQDGGIGVGVLRPGFSLPKKPNVIGIADSHGPLVIQPWHAGDESDIPNAILISTCESEPDEVAVPLNALDHRFCDTVQAVAYRADDTGSYAVSADYTWSIADESVAAIVPLPGQEHGGVQRPMAKYDILWAQDQSHEPETTIKVCAEPKGGWPWPNHGPLCRTLPLRDVVNLDAAWCFSGATFGLDDTCWKITQDGRYLQVDQDGQGNISGKTVIFYKGEYFYQATLTARDAMSGTVIDAYTKQPLGSWQAERLNP